MRVSHAPITEVAEAEKRFPPINFVIAVIGFLTLCAGLVAAALSSAPLPM